jgi:hypothetical protein
MFILEQKHQIPDEDMKSQFQQSPLKTVIVKENNGKLQCNDHSIDHGPSDLGSEGWIVLYCIILPQLSVFSLETDASRVGLEKLSISQTAEPGSVLSCPREQKSTVHGKNVFQNYQIPGEIGEKSDSPEMREYKTHVMGSPIFPIRWDRRKIR